MIFFKIFHDFSPQATSPFAAGEKNSPQAKRTRRRRRELAAGETHPFAAGEENSPPGETLYRFSRYQSMVSEMPRAKSYCGS